MDEQTLKKLLDEALYPIKKQLEDPDSGLGAINRRLDANTAATVELESTIKGYADAYKVNKKNIERLDERLTTVEDQLDIQPSDQLVIHR